MHYVTPKGYYTRIQIVSRADLASFVENVAQTFKDIRATINGPAMKAFTAIPGMFAVKRTTRFAVQHIEI